MELTPEQIAEYELRATMAERERCAKIADQVAINCARRAAEHTRLDAIASARDKQFSAEEVAHKIRGTWLEA